MKVCLNGPGHMTKMDAMPIHGKNLKKSSPEPKGWWPFKLGMVLEYYQVCSNDDPVLTLTYFIARSNLVPYAFAWVKGKIKDFSETIVVYDLKLATDDRSDKKFLLTSKLCPLGFVCPCPGAIYTFIKSWKEKCIKSDLKETFFKLATNDWGDKMFLLT